MCDRNTTIIKTSWGYSREFPINVGLHQGSALSPFWFVTVMDVMIEVIQKEPPWSLLLNDDFVICAKDCETLQINFEQWRS